MGYAMQWNARQQDGPGPPSKSRGNRDEGEHEGRKHANGVANNLVFYCQARLALNIVVKSLSGLFGNLLSFSLSLGVLPFLTDATHSFLASP